MDDPGGKPQTTPDEYSVLSPHGQHRGKLGEPGPVGMLELPYQGYII